jgi:hypothetical protein
LWKASREGTSSTLFLVFWDLFFEPGMGSGCGVKRLSSIYVWVAVRTYLWTCISNMRVARVRTTVRSRLGFKVIAALTNRLRVQDTIMTIDRTTVRHNWSYCFDRTRVRSGFLFFIIAALTNWLRVHTTIMVRSTIDLTTVRHNWSYCLVRYAALGALNRCSEVFRRDLSY